MSISGGPWGHFTLPPPQGTIQGMYTGPPNPAYIPVQTRQNFNDYQPAQPSYQHKFPPLPQAHPTEPAEKKKVDWPPSVRAYVQRAFDANSILPDVSRIDMENQLKETISIATTNNTLHSIDWDNLPLPQHLIRAARAQAPLPWRSSPSELQYGSNGYANVNETASRKRKSQDVNGTNEDDSTQTPPWRNTNTRNNGFEDRVTYPSPAMGSRLEDRVQPAEVQSPKASSKFQKNLEKRQRRFDGGYKSTYKASPPPEANSGPVVGRSQKLEKQYFRLTAAPNPEEVRPEPILKLTLDMLKKRWRKESNYSYICDQFKSLRQDLTVQHIKNKFTVEVYEIHARIALEKGDPGEYNQCQTQLRALYAQNLGGNPMEFKAYRILYFIHTGNRPALNDVLADLTTAEKEDPAIKHAMGVRSALALGNYHKFFRLYLETPNMGAYLMDMFVVRERLAALSNICRAYKPDVKLRFISEELGFESDEDAARFICDYNGGSELLVETNEGEGIRFFSGKAGSIFETAKSEAFRRVDIKGQI